MKKQYKVFFNDDCGMYGVWQLVIDNGSGRKMFWQQMLPPTGKGARRGQSAYTYYKGVAERWLKELEGAQL